MHYKTLVLELLQQDPMLYQTLRADRTLRPTLDRTARALKDRHAYWTATLSQKRPESTVEQITGEALEIAVQELRDTLPAESPKDAPLPEPLSLDAAIALLRRHTPPA